jgi:hypothetical protein
MQLRNGAQEARAMPKFTVDFHVSDHLLPLLDKVRDPISREDFFRKAIEYGINYQLESAIRMSNDFLSRRLTTDNHDYAQARAALRIDAPLPPDDSAASPKAEITTLRRTSQSPG